MPRRRFPVNAEVCPVQICASLFFGWPSGDASRRRETPTRLRRARVVGSYGLLTGKVHFAMVAQACLISFVSLCG